MVGGVAEDNEERRERGGVLLNIVLHFQGLLLAAA